MWLLHFYEWFWMWFAVHTGTYNEVGPYYGFFSGFGSDLGEYVLVGSSLSALIMLYKKINCHVDERPIGGKNCRKIGLHHVAGGKYIVCRHHHPDMGKDHVVSAITVAAAHEEYNKT